LIDNHGVNGATFQFAGQREAGRSRTDYKDLVFGFDI
jgi:hypothetical protein